MTRCADCSQPATLTAHDGAGRPFELCDRCADWHLQRSPTPPDATTD